MRITVRRSQCLLIALCIVALIGVVSLQDAGYGFISLLIVAFIICDTLFLAQASMDMDSLTIKCFRLFSAVRYVVIPLIDVFTGNYHAGYSSTPNYNSAIILMCYELLASSLFIALYSHGITARKIENQKNDIETIASNSRFVVWSFIILAVILCLIFPSALNQLSFITPRISAAQEEAASIFVKLTVFLAGIAKNLAFISVIIYLHKKYTNRKMERYYIASLLIACLNVAVYFGTTRISIVLSAVVTCVVLNKLYPQKVKSTYAFVLTFMAIAVINISIARNVMMHVETRSDVFDSFASMIDAYLGGPHNVGVAIKTAEDYSGQFASVQSFIAEFFRYVIGLSIIYKGRMIQTSGIFFNLAFSNGASSVGQVIPIIGVGCYYFGVIAAPILEILFLHISLRLERITRKSFDPRMFFFISLFSVRAGMIGGQNPQLLMSNLIANVVIPLVLLKINRHLVVRKTETQMRKGEINH